jgi:hypothetical protein
MNSGSRLFGSFFTDFKKTALWRAAALQRQLDERCDEAVTSRSTELALQWYERTLAPSRSPHQAIVTSFSLLFSNLSADPVLSWRQYRDSNVEILERTFRLDDSAAELIAVLVYGGQHMTPENLAALVQSRWDSISSRAAADVVLSRHYGHLWISPPPAPCVDAFLS